MLKFPPVFRGVLEPPIHFGISAGGLSPGAGGLSWPRLSPSSTSTDAIAGDVIGTLTVGGGWPRLSPSITSTDAVTGDLIGTIKV